MSLDKMERPGRGISFSQVLSGAAGVKPAQDKKAVSSRFSGPDEGDFEAMDAAGTQASAAMPLKEEPPQKNRVNASEKAIVSLDTSLIDDSPFQPRLVIDPDELNLLAMAIASRGELPSPIVVRRKSDGRFELIAGHRRLRAVRDNLLWKSVDAIIKDVSDSEAAILATIDNKSVRLSDFEYGAAYKNLMDMGVFASQSDLARCMGVDKGTISRRLAFLRLPSEVLERLKKEPALIGPMYVAEFISLCDAGLASLVIASLDLISVSGISQGDALQWVRREAEKRSSSENPEEGRKGDGSGKEAEASSHAPNVEPLTAGGREVAKSSFKLKGKRLVLDFENPEEAKALFEEFKVFLAQRPK